MFFWFRKSGAQVHFIQPGKPTQNAFVESFNGKFRDSCLNPYWLLDLTDARQAIETWRVHYNEVRPYSAPYYQPAAVFARQAA